MTAHSSGTGTGWLETLDIDQPHGLDFQEFNDFRIGVGNRMKQEHADFADNTVGGIHKPGGSAVLGIDDDTATVVADGTYRGHGIVWDGSVNLWCATAVAGATTTGDWTILKMHPDKQWGGQDITWTGAAEFDASVDISGNTTIEGDLTIEGALRLDGSADFSDVFIEGDVTIAGKLVIDSSADFSDVFIEGDVSVNGVLKVDGTATEFGGTEGIGLFYDPTAYAGGETSTLGNSIILKSGTSASSLAGEPDISYASPFPNAVISVSITPVDSANQGNPAIIVTGSSGVTGFTGTSNGATAGFNWIAIGH